MELGKDSAARQQPGRLGRLPLHPCVPSGFALSLPMQGGHAIGEGTFPLKLIFLCENYSGAVFLETLKGINNICVLFLIQKNTNNAYCVSWLQAVFL